MKKTVIFCLLFLGSFFKVEAQIDSPDYFNVGYNYNYNKEILDSYTLPESFSEELFEEKFAFDGMSGAVIMNCAQQWVKNSFSDKLTNEEYSSENTKKFYTRFYTTFMNGIHQKALAVNLGLRIDVRDGEARLKFTDMSMNVLTWSPTTGPSQTPAELIGGVPKAFKNGVIAYSDYYSSILLRKEKRPVLWGRALASLHVTIEAFFTSFAEYVKNCKDVEKESW